MRCQHWPPGQRHTLRQQREVSTGGNSSSGNGGPPSSSGAAEKSRAAVADQLHKIARGESQSKFSMADYAMLGTSPTALAAFLY